ncbi:MAG: hemolysin family protein [Verrucomicrobiales bacterium]
MATELLIVLVLLLTNGAFAMAEIALISARKAQLKRAAGQGDARAKAALQLAESPTRFLSTVQFGITLIGVLAGVYGGDTVVQELALRFGSVPVLAAHAHWLAVAAVVLGLTFFSLVLGELVPKRVALWNPESIACLAARPLRFLSRIFAPGIRVLAACSDWILSLFGIHEQDQRRITDDQIKDLMQEGLQAGVFDKAESQMVESVLELDSLAVREIMTPRPKIIFIGKDEPHEQVWHKVVVSGHSIFPVYEGNRDNIVGVVSVKSMYANLAAGQPARVKDLMVKPLVVPETQTVRQLLGAFKKVRVPLALVADEFGGIAGLITLSDVAQAVLGDFPSQHERLLPEARQRDDGSWLIDGLYDIDELAEQLTGVTFPHEPGRDYQTLAGFVVTHLAHVPTEAEWFDWQGWRFEIIDMDHHRVDKVLVTPCVQEPSSQAAPVRS